MKIKWYKRILPPACLAIFLFRLLEVRMVTDSATGMVKVNSAAEILFNVVLALLALFFCSALFMKREPKPAAPRLYRENKSDAIFGIGGAVLTVTAGLFRFFSELTDGVFALDLRAGSLLAAFVGRGLGALPDLLRNLAQGQRKAGPVANSFPVPYRKLRDNDGRQLHELRRGLFAPARRLYRYVLRSCRGGIGKSVQGSLPLDGTTRTFDLFQSVGAGSVPSAG